MRFLRNYQRRRALRVAHLSTLLNHADSTQVGERDDAAAAARLLQPRPGVLGEDRRAAMRDQMLRAATLEQRPTSADAGTHDDTTAQDPGVHTSSVVVPEGSVVLANLEPVSDADAVRVAQDVLDLVALRDLSRDLS